GSNEAAHRPKWAEREPGGRAAAEAAGARADAGRKRGAERVGRSEGRGAAKESVARISGSGCGRTRASDVDAGRELASTVVAGIGRAGSVVDDQGRAAAVVGDVQVGECARVFGRRETNLLEGPASRVIEAKGADPGRARAAQIELPLVVGGRRGAAE